MNNILVSLLFIFGLAVPVAAQNKLAYTDQQAKEQIEKLYDQLQKGADFGELARQYSQDVGSGEKGGDLGWSKPGTFVDAFEKEVRALAVHAFTKPFQTEFGYHIAQLIDKKGQQIRTRHILIRPAGR
ncbi:peptidylprolyl isomerase [Larkinella ripae]